MQEYMTEYEYELEEALQAFSLEEYTFAFEKAVSENVNLSENSDT